MKFTKKSNLSLLLISLALCLTISGYALANQSDFHINLNQIFGTIKTLKFNSKSVSTEAISYQNKTYVKVDDIAGLLDKEATDNGNTNSIDFRNKITTAKGTYSGEIKRDGKGSFTWSTGNTYNGDWKSGNIDGKGTIKYKNGDQYTGSFMNGKKNGEGKYIWTNGETYSGTWKNDIISGKGTYIFKNGDEYEGDWLNNKMEGQGKYTYKNGTILDGTWKNNKYTK